MTAQLKTLPGVEVVVIDDWQRAVKMLLDADGYMVSHCFCRHAIGEVMGDLRGQRFYIIGEATYQDAVRQALMVEELVKLSIVMPPTGGYFYKVQTD